MTSDRAATRDLPARPGGRGAGVAAVALAAVWCVSAVFGVAHLRPGPVDRGWDACITAASDPAAHAVAAALGVIGTGLPASALAVLVGVLIAIRRGPVQGALVVVASSLSALDVAGMKALAMRARPDAAFGTLNAFPSGHTANAALLGAVVFLLVRHVAVRCVAVAWALAMAWSRTELHAHWLTDVLAGLVVGAATAVLLLVACRALVAAATRPRPDPDGRPRAGSAP